MELPLPPLGLYRYNHFSPTVAVALWSVVQFGVAGQPYYNIARLSTNGSLDTTFSPITGSDGIIHTLGWQFDGRVVAGGEFTHFNGFNNNYIVRLNGDGSIDTTNWFGGTGADDAVNDITLQEDGTMYRRSLSDL